MTRPALGFTGDETWEELTGTLRACIAHVAAFDQTCATELDAVVYERERRLTTAVELLVTALIVQHARPVPHRWDGTAWRCSRCGVTSAGDPCTCRCCL